MNILPQQLKGKVVKDCYQDWDGHVIIEFTDGTKIRIQSERRSDFYSGDEISIKVLV